MGEGGNADLVSRNMISEKFGLETKTRYLTFVMSPGRVAGAPLVAQQ